MRSEVETYGVTSSVARLRRVLVRTPATSGDFAGAGWRQPDPATLLRQHAAFCELLSDLGCDVVVAPPADGPRRRLLHVRLGLHDRRRCHRPALGEAARATEWEPAAAALADAGVPVVAHLEGDATADGGDLFFLDARHAGGGSRISHQRRRAPPAGGGADAARRHGGARRPRPRPRRPPTCCTRCRSSRRSPTTWRSCSSG